MPGLGQLIHGEWRKALLFFGAGMIAAYAFTPGDTSIDPADPFGALPSLLLASVPFLVISLWSAIDAFRSLPSPPALPRR